VLCVFDRRRLRYFSRAEIVIIAACALASSASLVPLVRSIYHRQQSELASQSVVSCCVRLARSTPCRRVFHEHRLQKPAPCRRVVVRVLVANFEIQVVSVLGFLFASAGSLSGRVGNELKVFDLLARFTDVVRATSILV